MREITVKVHEIAVVQRAIWRAPGGEGSAG